MPRVLASAFEGCGVQGEGGFAWSPRLAGGGCSRTWGVNVGEEPMADLAAAEPSPSEASAPKPQPAEAQAARDRALVVPERRGDLRNGVTLCLEDEHGSKPGVESSQIVQCSPGLDLLERRGGVILTEVARARHEDLVAAVCSRHVMGSDEAPEDGSPLAGDHGSFRARPIVRRILVLERRDHLLMAARSPEAGARLIPDDRVHVRRGVPRLLDARAFLQDTEPRLLDDVVHVLSRHVHGAREPAETIGTERTRGSDVRARRCAHVHARPDDSDAKKGDPIDRRDEERRATVGPRGTAMGPRGR